MDFIYDYLNFSKRHNSFRQLVLSGLLVVTFSARLFAQAPSISYTSPHTDTAGKIITSLSPISSNVAVPAYGRATAAVGSGFINPFSTAVDAAGNIYIADAGNNTIKKIPAGGGSPVSIGTGFNGPAGVAVDAAGNVYVADQGNNLIKKISVAGGATVTLATGYYFNNPTGIAVDAVGNIYVADAGSGKIDKILASDGTMVTLAGFNFPYGVAIDALGNVYVADGGDNNIQEIPAGGGNPIVVGSGFNSPHGVAVDAEGNVFVADYGNHLVKEIPVGSNTSVVIGSGFTGPTGVTADGAGNIYVAEYTGNSVKEIQPLGGYFVSPFLPVGLKLDNTTGIVSGTPVYGSAATNYKVTAYNAAGTASSATVNIKVSSAANLSNLLTSIGTLSPAFATGTTTYTVSVDDASMQVNPTSADPASTIRVNGTLVASATASVSIPLIAGSNAITILVTAADGTTTNTYTVNATRIISSDASLSYLFGNNFSISPNFQPNVTTYNATVYNSNPVQIIPGTNSAKAVVKINGVAVASGSYTGGIPLIIGNNVITTVVTAEDGITTRTYTINIVRQPLSIATLSNIMIDGAVLSPAYNSTVNTYTTAVDINKTSIKLTPVPYSGFNEMVAVNGVLVASGGQSGDIPLAAGLNTIKIIVTAEDGVTKNTYTITVNRVPLTDATLSGLNISNGTLSPGFTSGTINYTATVGVPSISVTPVTTDAQATIKVNGAVATSNTPLTVALAAGTNTISVVVTAGDGVTTKTYTVNLTRTTSSDATLGYFQTTYTYISGQAYNQPAVNNSATVGYTNNSVEIYEETVSIGATVKINGVNVPLGGYSLDIPLAVGENVIAMVVTAEDRITTKTYTLVVTRLQSADATLSNLIASCGKLSPDFNPVNGTYKISVSNNILTTTVTPTVNFAGVAVTVNGVANASGAPSANIPLSVGDNIITTKVTALDGTTVTNYTITVTRIFLPPTVSYTTPHTYTTGVAINPLTPTATGVAAAGGYNSNITTFAEGFNNPFGLAVDAAGNVYVTDANNNTANKIPAGGGAAIVIATGLNTPTGIAVDAAGNVYIADSGNNAIKKIPAGGGAMITVGSGFNQPMGVAVDAAGNLYICDTNNNLVKKIAAGSNTPVTLLACFHPEGIAIDITGNVYIAITSNHVVEMISAVDNSTHIIGGAIGSPIFVTVDALGNTYIIDEGNLLKAAQGAKFATFIAAAQNSSGVAVDGTGKVFFSNSVTGSVQQITPSGGYYVTPVLPAGLSLDKNTGVISGTPTASSASTNYTVTGYNNGGGGSAIVNIKTTSFSSDARLSGLNLSAGSFTGVFRPDTTDYAISVGNSVTSITATPYANDGNATIKVNSTTVVSGSASGTIPLKVGPNTVNVVVTAQDGIATKTYTVVVTRLSNNANLSNLAISGGALSPAFLSSTVTYSTSVPNVTSSITLTPTTSDVNATVQVNGVTVASGTASASIPLAQGANSIHAVVHAQDGTQKTYTVTVTRLPNNANLANLTISTGTLSPAFTSQTTVYTSTVTNATTSITVTPTTSDTKATVTVGGAATTSGTASAAIRLNGGVNTIYIVGIAQDGTRKTYTLTITKPLSSNANLSNLAISSGSLAPVFVSSTVGYTATVSATTTSIQLTPTTSDINATVQVNSITVKSGSASASVPLGVGVNSVHAVVHAQDGTQRTYTVTVTRLSNNANMASLTVSSGRLSPAFVSSITSYLDTVSNATSSIQITPTTSEAHATVTVSGTAVTSGSASAAIPLVVGNNTIYTVVLAQDGTRKTYTITVRRLTTGGLNNLYLPGSSEQTPLISLLGKKVEANNILSPNGDGINDTWVVKNIAFYPDNTVTVYNRAGEVVFTKKGYTNDWDGTYRGAVLNEGTYYYLVDLGNGKSVKGFITVVRDK